jgi:dihydropteroate synthase
MGVVNVTPDSFSGDGTGMDPARAAALTEQIEADGADIIDLGSESTRPGAEAVDEVEELRRLLPSLRAVRRTTSLPLSVDTHRARVAAAALAEGADIVNDIWGLRSDPDMARTVAEAGAPLVAMHNQRGRQCKDVAGDILAGWGETLTVAERAGIQRDRIILDPGFGFGWSPEQNLEMIRRLPELRQAGLPILIGVSRKSTIGLVLDKPAGERLMGTAAAVALAIAGGADLVRVHDVPAMAEVAKMSDAIARGTWKQG